MEIVVTNCKDCIFKEINYQSEEPYCKLDKQGRDLITIDKLGEELGEETPEWCPIKNESITVKLKQNKSTCEHKSSSSWGRLATCLDCGYEWIRNDYN